MKLLIAVPAYNRKAITGLCLENLEKYKGEAELWVYNDWSTEYGCEWLAQWADKVIQLPASSLRVVKNEKNVKGMGVQHLRWHQFREFLDLDQFDYLYMTDADTLHDPGFVQQLESCASTPGTLYSSKTYPKEISTRWGTRDSAGGVSHLYSKQDCERVVARLAQAGRDPEYGWDYESVRYLGRGVRYTQTSYLEHFGAGGLHSGPGRWDHDRAKNPTEYLRRLRPKVINYLEGVGPRPEV